MKQNKLPSNSLDIITPVVSSTLHLGRDAEAYPELVEIKRKEPGGRQNMYLYPMTAKTPLPARKATEIIASYFRREFGYDFLPYQANEDTDARDRVFLMTQEADWETEYAIGAIAFRWRKYSNAPEQLVLAWVWIHPFLRRKGILTAYWDIFRKHYGHFHVEPPLSKKQSGGLHEGR